MTQFTPYSQRRLDEFAAPNHDSDQVTRPILQVVSDDLTVNLREPSEQLELDLRVPESPHLEPHEGLLGASRWARAAKRALDLVVASVGLAALAPVLASVALLVRLTSPGPAIHVQYRVGRQGQVFRFFKFRTMHLGAEEHKARLQGANESNGPVFKIRSDPRVTSVGRILRKLSIDELPQLIHVFKGEMTLVGPRPPLVEEVETYREWERQRLLVKPGITCIWQVSGRSDLDFHTWVQMDIDYIRQWTLWLDVKLLARTVPAVLTGRGAY